MKSGHPVKELEQEHKQLVHGMRLPDSVLNIESRNTYKHFDLSFARELIGADQPWGSEDAFDPKNRIVLDVFLAGDEGKQLYFASEIDLLRRIKETAEDIEHRGPFDIFETIYPIRLRGKVIHIIRTGKYRIAPFNEKDLKELAFLCGVPIKTVREAVACLPIYPPEQVDDLKRVHKRLRDSVKLALREHVRLMELTAQQLQQERLSSLGSLAEGMAHHFSNLLSIILGYSSLLFDRPEFRKGHEESIRKITEAAQRGRRFTEEILALSESFNDEEPAATSLHERLNGSLTLLQSRLKAGIKLVTKFDATSDQVIAPPGIIHHIAFNAIAHAIDSMPNGGRLEIATKNRPAGNGADASTQVQITITDSGFPVSRARPTTADETGSGESLTPKMTSLLGLVASLDGNATTRTDADGTTTLEIILPAATEAETTAPQKRVRRRLAPSHIWVADDDEVVREMCRRVLTEEGHEVEEVATGHEFANRFTTCETPPELLIYDFGMPDITGLEICHWLRDNNHRTPVILISGFGSDHPEIKKALKMRKTFLLQKPFSFRDMSDLVTIALGDTLIEEIPVA